MAKLATAFDLATYSPLIGVFGTPITTARRELGAVEYSTSLNINSSGAKVIIKFDLASYSQLINRAGTNPTVRDIRGATVLGAQRDWGAVEYNSALAFHTSAKLITDFDLAGYSQLVNYEKPTAQAFTPTTKDLRGNTAAFNAKSSHNTSTYFPTTADIRSVDAIDGFREQGAVEYDDTLAIANSFPTVTETAEAIWSFAVSTLKGSDYAEKAGGYVASQAIRSSVASAGSSTTITVDGGSSSVDDFYNSNTITILSGTGAGQTRRIDDYVGSTRVATVNSAWTTTPDNTSVFAIRPSVNVPTAAENADAVWDEATSGHLTAGTFGKLQSKLLTVAKFLGLKKI